MHSPPMETMNLNGMATLPKNRRPSMKRKKPEGQELAGLMMHEDMYSQAQAHHLAMSHPNLEEMQQHALGNKMLLETTRHRR